MKDFHSSSIALPESIIFYGKPALMAGAADTLCFIRDILNLHSINPIVLPADKVIVKLLKKQVIAVAVIVAGMATAPNLWRPSMASHH